MHRIDNFFQEADETSVLILIYLLFAQFSDGSLEQKEIQTSIGSVQKWFPDMERMEFSKRVIQATQYFNQLAEENNEAEAKEALDRSLEILKDKKLERRESMLMDLLDIAYADEEFTESEKAWFSRIAEVWEIDIEEYKKKYFK